MVRKVLVFFIRETLWHGSNWEEKETVHLPEYLYHPLNAVCTECFFTYCSHLNRLLLLKNSDMSIGQGAVHENKCQEALKTFLYNKGGNSREKNSEIPTKKKSSLRTVSLKKNNTKQFIQFHARSTRIIVSS